MAGSKVRSVQVSFGFSEGKSIGNLIKPQYFDAGDLESADVLAVIVDHGEKFTHVFNGFSLVFVLHEQSRRRPLFAMQDQIDEVFSRRSWRAELDGAQAVDSWKHTEMIEEGSFVESFSTKHGGCSNHGVLGIEPHELVKSSGGVVADVKRI